MCGFVGAAGYARRTPVRQFWGLTRMTAHARTDVAASPSPQRIMKHPAANATSTDSPLAPQAATNDNDRGNGHDPDATDSLTASRRRFGDGLVGRVRKALDRATANLIAQQHPDGYWCAELEGDSILESEYILLKWIISQEDDPRLPRIANYLRKLQQDDGAWVQYPGAKCDLGATVKGYFALKLCGDPVDAPHMVRAREQIIHNGGAERCNSFTKFYLAALGQISYDAVPSIPPEIIYLPKWFYFNLDNVSAWTRTMITPLSIVTSYRPIRKLDAGLGIDELYVDQRARHRLQPQDGAHRHWSKVFLTLDRLLKLIDLAGMTPLRRGALRRIEEWLIERTERSDGLGAIFPPMVYILIALRCRGFSEDHPKVVEAHKHLDDLMIHDQVNEQIRIQPCFSPIWDTGIALYALTNAGLNRSHRALRRCARWLASKECRQAGDWAANVSQKVEPSGWYFEYNNGFYPDVDDTAMVAMALKHTGGRAAEAAAQRGVQWAMAMQNNDGGWAAFDRTTDRPLLEHVPFADHNAIQDPSCPDITGRTLECMGHHGYDVDHPAVQKAIAFIRSKQEPEGGWFGRWGVNYIYGAWQVLCGLRAVSCDMNQPWIQKAGLWLKKVQQADGSFGESADSYENRSQMGRGPATASQTAWGVMGLLAVFGPNDADVKRGLNWLCETQLDDQTPPGDPRDHDGPGGWCEPYFTGTGFPRVFYLRYHLYRLYFPIMCLGRWLGEIESKPADKHALAGRA